MFLQKFISFSFISVLIIFCSSCNLINKKEQIPSYIRIDSIKVSTHDNPEYGSNSSKITDAWVYVDDQVVGAFELPAKVPILKTGIHTVKIFPGIKVNGIAATRAIYPFYQPYTTSMNLIAGINNAITVNPTLTYYSTTVFQWEESFESAGISIKNTVFSDTTINKTSAHDPLVYEGAYSGVIYLDASHSFFQGTEIDSCYLPNGESPVFLEMNYKTNESINVGLYGINGSEVEKLDILTINKSDTWNKIYVNLNNAINRTSINAQFYKVFFEVTKTDDVAEPVILMDNIKLLCK
jgi:hypothetical protein